MPHHERESYLEPTSRWVPTRRGRLAPAGLYRRVGKRMFDVIGATVGLILLAPLLAVFAILSKLTSGGSVIFRQERVGKNGSVFTLIKFRTMASAAQGRNLPITVSGDPRITAFGAFLRRYKFDELPQLWNVLRGEMSLVGPRPELPEYVETFSEKDRVALSVCPGITDPASLAYRHEEELLSRAADPEEFYRRTILPHKLSLNLEYIEQMSFALDARLILQTLRSMFESFPGKNGQLS